MEFVNTEKVISKYLDEQLLSNVAIKVAQGATVYYERYFSKNNKITETTLFDMASVTKIMATTLLTLIAIDEKKISYNAFVADIFPETPTHFKTLTIAHLLTHTSGIGAKYLYRPENNYENIHHYILNLNSNPIGVEVEYSCPAFILLGKILENIYGKRLDALFDEKIAIPLGLTHTCYNPLKKGYADFVNSNLADDDKGLVNDGNCRFLGGVAGNAGLFSCIKDLTIFIETLLNKDKSFISEATLASALHNFTPNMSESRGMGFLCSDDRYLQTGTLFNDHSFGHCGHTGQSVFFNIRSGLYVIVLSDATLSTVRKYGEERYDDVIKFREALHNAIKNDLIKEC